jgi:hypothetical protein
MYIAGEFYSTVAFGSTTFVSSGDKDIFISKLSATGLFLRTNKAGGTNGDTSL